MRIVGVVTILSARDDVSALGQCLRLLGSDPSACAAFHNTYLIVVCSYNFSLP